MISVLAYIQDMVVTGLSVVLFSVAVVDLEIFMRAKYDKGFKYTTLAHRYFICYIDFPNRIEKLRQTIIFAFLIYILTGVALMGFGENNTLTFTLVFIVYFTAIDDMHEAYFRNTTFSKIRFHRYQKTKPE